LLDTALNNQLDGSAGSVLPLVNPKAP